MPEILEINRIVSSISAEAPERIFETLERLAASGSLEKLVAKAACHGLECHLQVFTTVQLIKIARFYIEADSTSSVLFTRLLEEFRRRFNKMSQEEFSPSLPDGGEAGAILFSLVQTCRGLGGDPRAYLEDIMRRIMSHNSLKLHELLPDQWIAGF
ncbi:MAG: transposase domain-containing protein [Chlamydiales bacterium]